MTVEKHTQEGERERERERKKTTTSGVRMFFDKQKKKIK